MRAELFVIVHARTAMDGQTAHHPAELRIGAADLGFGGRVEARFKLGPFMIAAESQREAAQQAVFTAQRDAIGAAVAGKGLRPGTIAIGALGIGQAVRGAQGQVVAVIGKADIAPVTRGFLRIVGIGEDEIGCGKAIDFDVTFCKITMREQLEAGGQIEEGAGADSELLRSVGFRARCGCGKSVGLEP